VDEIFFGVGVPFVTVGFILLVSYLVDRRAHEGIDVFRRRSVLRNGQLAQATVLSSTMLMTGTGSKFNAAYSIVYEVHPLNGPPFRTRAIETMYYSEHSNNISVGATVNVRFDPKDNLVVLVRIKEDKVRSEEDARRRAREDALLRKPP
jgi:hypothetical protein